MYPPPNRLRVATAQYFIRPVRSFDDFGEQVAAVVETAGSQGYGARLLVLPEYLTIQLLALDRSTAPITEKVRGLAGYLDRYVDLFRGLAKANDLYIVGGTIPVIEGERVFNDAYLFAPSGEVATQGKLHMTRWEREEWRVSERDRLRVFQTDFGKIAIAICYDVEFPEIIRAVAREDIDVLCVPSCTDDRHGFFRVRYCAQARCIENQVYVLHSSTVGGLPRVPDAALNYGQAAILTPCDFAFARDGILASGTPNNEDLVIGDLDLAVLKEARENGTVLPLKDSARSHEISADIETVAL